jgi:sigma-B regulation protein RsbU (phosphoserine phosphatase)
MAAGEPVTADCVGGDGTLYACPIAICGSERWYPKAAIVAAAHDIHRFHYADRLASATSRSVVEMEELMCQTDKRCLDAAQLRRMRAIISSQAVSFSRQISNRYEELQATAIAAARAEELASAYAQVDRECRIVGQVQRGLVPRKAPDISGFATAIHYAIARRASGDYYDFFPNPDGSCGIIIADVSGHGAGAAVVLAMMRAIIHTLHGELMPPHRALHYTNDHLCENILPDQFATAFFVVAESDGRLCSAAAGHNPPLLFEARSGEVREFEVETSVPLGTVPDADFKSSEAQLQRGDVLLLYTDGIPETFDPNGETFGTDRVAQTLRQHAAEGATAVRDAIVEQARVFAAGEPRHDDETLIVLEKL